MGKKSSVTNNTLFPFQFQVVHGVPKVVWVFWFGKPMSETRRQNVNNMESILQVPVVLITDDNLRFWLKEPIHPALKYLSGNHKSDYYRAYFGLHYGGGYADIKKMVESWDVFFELFKDPDVWIIGIPEIKGGFAPLPGAEYPPDFEERAVSNSWFISRPGNPILKKVQNMQHDTLDKHHEALKIHPSPGDRCCQNGEEGYPLRWVELFGELMGFACLPHLDRLARVLKLPENFGYF